MTQEANELAVYKPYDQTLIQRLRWHTAQEAEAMLDKAVAVFKDRNAWLPIHHRIDLLNQLATAVENETEAFALLIAQEGGKPLKDAKVEVIRAIDGVRLASKELLHVMRGEEIPMGHTAASEHRTAYTTYEPIGVVLAISAFNHPLNLIVHQVIPAVAVGCPVIVKPASTTPLSCLKLIDLLHEVGLPKPWCQVCLAENDVAEMLVKSDKINFLTFIGSAKVGWWLKSQLAPGVRCALEHGGVAPVIMDDTADLAKTIPLIVKGGFYHAGQVCVSVQRVYVPNRLIEAFTSDLKIATEKLLVGDPTLSDTDVGPLILPREVERVHEWVQQAVKEGAQLLLGGHPLSDTCYAPTILLNPSEASLVSTKEVFGPIICVYGYDDVDDAIERANGLDVAFQAAVFTEKLSFAQYCIDRLDASAVMVNDHTAFRVDWMPFAGRRASGYGIGGIGYTMHDMLQVKMAVFNHTP